MDKYKSVGMLLLIVLGIIGVSVFAQAVKSTVTAAQTPANNLPPSQGISNGAIIGYVIMGLVIIILVFQLSRK